MRDANDGSKTWPFSISRYRLAVTERTLECDVRHILAGRMRGDGKVEVRVTLTLSLWRAGIALLTAAWSPFLYVLGVESSSHD